MKLLCVRVITLISTLTLVNLIKRIRKRPQHDPITKRVDTTLPSTDDINFVVGLVSACGILGFDKIANGADFVLGDAIISTYEDEFGKFECSFNNVFDYMDKSAEKKYEGEDLIQSDLCENSRRRAEDLLKEINSIMDTASKLNQNKNITDLEKKEYKRILEKQGLPSFRTHYKLSYKNLIEAKSELEKASKADCASGFKISFFDNIKNHLKRGYSALKFLYHCYFDMTILLMGFQFIVEQVLHFFTLGSLKFIKIGIIFAYMLMYLYKYWQSTTSPEVNKYKGSVIGSLIRIALELLNFTGLDNPFFTFDKKRKRKSKSLN